MLNYALVSMILGQLSYTHVGTLVEIVVIIIIIIFILSNDFIIIMCQLDVILIFMIMENNECGPVHLLQNLIKSLKIER